MVSIREAVLLPGILKGMNLEAACTVRAVKVSLVKLDVWEYVSASVVQAPSQLPDGAYKVIFEGRMMKVNKIAGRWHDGEPHHGSRYPRNQATPRLPS